MRMHLVIFQIGYMENYNGVAPIWGGGEFPDKDVDSGECWNFQSYKRKVYGFVMTKGNNGVDAARIAGTKKWNADRLTGVTVVFVAPSPSGGKIIVGWYRNATVLHKHVASCRMVPTPKGRKPQEYACFANSENAVLLEPEERENGQGFLIPRGKDMPGQNRIWYADKNKPKRQKLAQQILLFIQKHGQRLKETIAPRIPRPDSTTLREIETAAENEVVKYYTSHDYILTPRQTDYCGWDFDAVKGDEMLLIEVKGHVHGKFCFELTPNEYLQMQKLYKVYRVCVVRHALTHPTLDIFVPRLVRKKKWELVPIARAGAKQARCTPMLLRERTGAKVGL